MSLAFILNLIIRIGNTVLFNSPFLSGQASPKQVIQAQLLLTTLSYVLLTVIKVIYSTDIDTFYFNLKYWYFYGPIQIIIASYIFSIIFYVLTSGGLYLSSVFDIQSHQTSQPMPMGGDLRGGISIGDLSSSKSSYEGSCTSSNDVGGSDSANSYRSISPRPSLTDVHGVIRDRISAPGTPVNRGLLIDGSPQAPWRPSILDNPNPSGIPIPWDEQGRQRVGSPNPSQNTLPWDGGGTRIWVYNEQLQRYVPWEPSITSSMNLRGSSSGQVERFVYYVPEPLNLHNTDTPISSTLQQDKTEILKSSVNNRTVEDLPERCANFHTGW